MTTYEDQAIAFECIAQALESAALHASIVAKKFREHDVPRASAHAFSCLGHMNEALQNYNQCATNHAKKSQLE